MFPKLEFAGKKFIANCSFRNALFREDAHFANAVFTQKADFCHAAFQQEADFFNVTFLEKAYFSNAVFTKYADFSSATFNAKTYFSGSTFTGKATFSSVAFKRNVDFYDATFTGDANFGRTEFHGVSTWENATFLEGAEFRRTKFDPQVAGEPGAVFAMVRFTKPNEVIFEHVDLSRALFQNCDVTELRFTSSVDWGRQGKRRGVIFEEVIPLPSDHAKDLQTDGERDYGTIAQFYQQLKKNYDAQLDFWTANEFHFGEMEMQRVSIRPDGRFPRLRRWWHPRLSFVALYRWASDYGNSFVKPMLWLLGFLVLFSILYPLPGAGLQRSGKTSPETYVSVWRAGPGHMQSESALLLRSALTSIDIVTFQKNPEYAPSYPWGRGLAIVETFLISTLFGLFLLAIRRQFRR